MGLRLDLRTSDMDSFETTKAGIIEPGVWYYVAVVYDPGDSNTVKFFVKPYNVQEISSEDIDVVLGPGITGNIANKNADEKLIVGGSYNKTNNNANDNNFKGRIDEIRIYNVALDESDIEEHYQQKGIWIRKLIPAKFIKKNKSIIRR